jgi:hypothetical protein
MIISKLQGGLGNQMFQWAYGMSLSVKHNLPFYLDISFYENQFGCTPRNFSLEKFPNLDFKLFKGWDSLHKNFSTPQAKIIKDDSIFREIEIQENFLYYLEGYWGSEKYFSENSDIIHRCLSYDNNFIEKIKNSIYKKVFINNVTSLHIRRTDYVTSNGYHPVQPITYYMEALSFIKEYDFLYVFSDDIEWCKKNLQFENILFVEGLDDLEDMWLMSLCKNNIIANSTFSWWGAWLNRNSNKIVISPSRWLGPSAGIIENDIIPPGWIKI